MNLGTYEIQNYTINLLGATQSRQKIRYIGNNGLDIFEERYYGTIRQGYFSSNMRFVNLLWTNIKSHIIGESILVDDSDGNPQIYISLSTISSIDRSGEKNIIITDQRYDPIYLEFQTEFDCNQANSVLNAVLEDPFLDINSLVVDESDPVIYFNEFFFSGVLNKTGSIDPGPHTSLDSLDFEVEVSILDITGGLPLSKSNILEELVEKVLDNRDTISYGPADLIIFKTLPDTLPKNTIDSLGNWWVRFTIGDIGSNTVVTNININII